jgi:sensor domain CHASE-containing protein
MIEIEIKADKEPQALAQLIASAVHGQPAEDASVTEAGKQIREEQEQAEIARGSWTDMSTVDFAKLDPENDWSDV